MEENLTEKRFEPAFIGCNDIGEKILGWKIIEQPNTIVVVVKIYKESERHNAITRMAELILKRELNKKVYIVDSEEFEREMKKYKLDDTKFNEFGFQKITYEFVDLITGRFVPIEIIAYK